MWVTAELAPDRIQAEDGREKHQKQARFRVWFRVLSLEVRIFVMEEPD